MFTTSSMSASMAGFWDASHSVMVFSCAAALVIAVLSACVVGKKQHSRAAGKGVAFLQGTPAAKPRARHDIADTDRRQVPPHCLRGGVGRLQRGRLSDRQRAGRG